MPYVYSMRDEKNNRCYPSRRSKDNLSWKEKKNTRREEREKSDRKKHNNNQSLLKVHFESQKERDVRRHQKEHRRKESKHARAQCASASGPSGRWRWLKRQ